MQPITSNTSTVALGVVAATVGIMVALAIAPTPANAFSFWWPWGGHAHAQSDDDNDEVTVTIYKYIDGVPANSENANGNSFPMSASWNDPEGIGASSGNFQLAAHTSPAYEAETSEFQHGADYSVSENLDTDVVGASCAEGHPFALVGYSTGSSEETAASNDSSTSSPELTNITSDKHVIVWNESCDDTPTTTPSAGTIIGEVTGGASEGTPGDLAVTSIEAEKTTAIANGMFADGWRYVFHITVPTDEPDLAMKFANWTQEDTDHIIPVAGNMRISSQQASATSTVTLSAENTYSSPELTMTDDLDEEEDGLQVEVLVEVAVPSGTFNGTYSTEYGVRTL